jgi:hypothetical protein
MGYGQLSRSPHWSASPESRDRRFHRKIIFDVRARNQTVSGDEISSKEKLRALLNILQTIAVTVFSAVWCVQMYLSYFGPTVPSPARRAIYPVTIHGGVIYATSWQHYFAIDGATYFFSQWVRLLFF